MMKISKKILSIILMSFLTFSILSIFWKQSFKVSAQTDGYLTGTTYDSGVDIDGDGAFDSLELGVEVNVTDAGHYEVYISGLRSSNSSYISVWNDKSEYLNAGVQVVDVSLYGPTIYTSGLNPVNISEISLYSVEYVDPFTPMKYWLDSVYNVPLSQEYIYTEFDSPFKDIEASFVVYPDGRVVMGGVLNFTHMVPPNPSLFVHGGATVEKSDTTTDLSASFTLTIPPEMASQFPYNSSGFTLLSEYSSGLLNTTVSGSTILPLSIVSELPFNITDFTVIGQCAGDMVEGNITVDIWSGFPLDDVVVDFQGNNTYVHINGSTTIIFGNYPNFGEINATFLEEILVNLTNTIGGEGPGSLYNMTNGILEFTMLNNVTTLHNGNATVNFEAKVEGDLIKALINMTGQPASMYDLLNATWSSIENGSLLLTYAHALGEFNVNLAFVANVTHLTDDIIPILPDLMPPDEAMFIESLLNTTYWTVNSAKISLDYNNNQAILTATANIQDFNAQLDYVKNLLLIFNFPQPFTPQLQTVNDTQIDLANLEMTLNLTETSMEVDISGFAVLPPLDWMNATSFKLERFLNITAIYSYPEPPGKGEKLQLTIAGGSNATHTVRIIRPGTVPQPDESAPGGMTWNNQSISELKDLIFQIGPRDDTPPEIGTPVQTPEVPDESEIVTVSVNITDADTGVRPDRVILSYRTNGGNWNNITMSRTTGDTYEGTIPGLPGGTQVEYMIVACDYANNEAIADRIGAYYVYIVISEFPTWEILAIAMVLIGVIIVIISRRTGHNIEKFISKSRQISNRAFHNVTTGVGTQTRRRSFL